MYNMDLVLITAYIQTTKLLFYDHKVNTISQNNKVDCINVFFKAFFLIMLNDDTSLYK